jgi:hypothetical protein
MSDAAHSIRTTEMIRQMLDSIASDRITLGELVDRFNRRGFGFVLLSLSLPAFIPIPGVAGVTGPLIAILGVQMIIGLRHPWVPAFARRKTLAKSSIESFTRRMGRPLKVMERFCQPRLPWLFDNAGNRATGVMVVLYGLLLSLPIPFTNYLFGLILLAMAIALIERDGMLLVSSWFVIGPLVMAVGVLLRNLRAWRLKRRRAARGMNGH